MEKIIKIYAIKTRYSNHHIFFVHLGPVVQNLDSTANVIPFDAFGKISVQANDQYTFTFILYKFHIALLSVSHIFHPLDSSLSCG